MLECTQTTTDPSPTTPTTAGNMGDPCIPQDEYQKDFSGYDPNEINVESRSPSCTTGVCLVANFSGRVSCPYGQPASPSEPSVADPNLPADERCYVPGASHDAVNAIDVPVRPELIGRPPSKAVYCSCRCDGPAGTGPFCDCPSGFECTHLVDAYGTSGGAQLPGSYCIRSGTAVTNSDALAAGPVCDRAGSATCDGP